MVAISLTVVVAGACLGAGIAGAAVTGRLARCRRSTLRAKLVTLFIGLIIAEALSLPTLILAVGGEDITGLSGSGFDVWLVVALYVSLTGYVIARLFPWREVDALVTDPDATLRGILAKLKAMKDDPNADRH